MNPAPPVTRIFWGIARAGEPRTRRLSAASGLPLRRWRFGRRGFGLGTLAHLFALLLPVLDQPLEELRVVDADDDVLDRARQGLVVDQPRGAAVALVQLLGDLAQVHQHRL